MTNRTVEASPRLWARIAGVLYLINVATSMFAEVFVRGKFVVLGDAAATAANVLARESLFRWAFASDLIATASYIAVTAILYDLFQPVNRPLSLIAAFFSLAGCVIGALSSLFHITPLIVLGGSPYLSVFRPDQVQALALLLFRLHTQAANIGIVFFGFYCLLIGYLVFRSTFLPRILGAGMMFAGLGWLTFLSPPLANYLYPYNLAPGGLGEIALTLWLLVVGVNPQRWKERAVAAAN